MSKFKVGNIIKPIGIPTPVFKILNIDILNQLYEMEVITSSFVNPNTLTHDRISATDLNYELVNNNPNKYQVADILLDLDGITQYLVTAIDFQNGLYYLKYIANKDVSLINTNTNYTFHYIHLTTRLITPDIYTSSINTINRSKDNQCKCDSFDLFNRGCKCGAIKSYKPKWG